MAQCAGIKRDGGRCRVGVGEGEQWCYNHDPARQDERKRNASRAGKSKTSGEIRNLKKQLEDLVDDVRGGRIERGDAVVVKQILNTRARLIELERKVKETEELEERLEALERSAEGHRGGRGWGA